MKTKSTVWLILSLILISCIISVDCKAQANGQQLFDSHLITQGIANKRIADYNKVLANVLHTFDTTGKKVKLTGFSFDASQIDEIINHNADGRTPDQLVVFFGFEKTIKRWHVIAFGMVGPFNANGGTALNQSNTPGQAASIFDNAVKTAISKPDADDEHNAYLTSPLVTNFKGNNNFKLEGFSFTATQINRVLARDAAGKPTIDKVVLNIGLQFVSNNKAKKRWHIIAFGMKNGAASANTAGATALIFDKADPCPPCKSL